MRPLESRSRGRRVLIVPYITGCGSEPIQYDGVAVAFAPRRKPIVIVPGVTPGMEPADDERMIVAYEQAGVNGQRMTVDVRGTVALVSDKDFAKIKFVGGHTPAGR